MARSGTRPGIFMLAIASLFFIVACNGQKSLRDHSSQVARDAHGITVSLRGGQVKTVRLQVFAEDIVRVTASPLADFNNLPDYLMVVAQPEAVPFDVATTANTVELNTRRLSARLDLRTGKVAFFDHFGTPLLKETERNFGPPRDDPGQQDADSYSVQQNFLTDTNEGFYGLGQQQNGLVNHAGHPVEITTHNLVIAVPFLVSSKNYGVLWNNAAVSRFGDPAPASLLQEGFDLFDAEGKKGGLTVTYFDGDRKLLTRVESDTNYQFLQRADQREFPLPAEATEAKDLRILIEGSLQAKHSGKYTLQMYSSGYAKLAIDGEVKLDRWRMNWNPWYHPLDLDWQKGEKKTLSLTWNPGGGYLRLLQNSPQPEGRMSLTSDTGKAVDYFFCVGDNKDQVISAYRRLTGKSVLLPKWAYGFWQSRERYKTQQEILDVLKEYRARKIPIDNIVLDWSYWPQDAWGSHDFDPQFFPDPRALVDGVHALNANIMISVWPKFYPETANYRELNAKGYMFNKNIEDRNYDWIGPGYLNTFYDAFAPEAREIFWRQMDKKLNSYGFDAWWLDAVEPDIHSNLSFSRRKDLMTPNALGTGAEYFNAYALPHAESVYQGDRRSDPDKRVFILTRSGFGGIQRTASAIWSGDIVSRWSDLKEQIAAGVGVGLSGVPNWTFDIGGFTPEDRYRRGPNGAVGPVSGMDPAQVDEWQELNTRWFQFGAFVPLFRSHGQNPYREIFNISDPGSDAYESMVWYTKMRYRLLPYIYSEAGDMYHKDNTLMRGLVMDFPADGAVKDIHDQYMFGPAFLINPVYEYKARSRNVYLPAGNDWFDFYSGEKLVGGQTVAAAAPYQRMPIFVKAGSIVPMGPEVQYVDEMPNAPITLYVYTGADGRYELYEDDGKSYAYENGAYSRIPFHYDDASGVLTIGRRNGKFAGMPVERTIHVRWISGDKADALDFNAEPDATVSYSGKSILVRRGQANL